MRSTLVSRLRRLRHTVVALTLTLLAQAHLAAPSVADDVQADDRLEDVIPEIKPIDQAELAGLPPGSRAEVFTMERAYTLALVRARAPKPRLLEALDPKALDEEARRLGVADFARFREDFLRPITGQAGRPVVRFRDPSASMLGVLEQLMAAESTGRSVEAIERLMAAYRPLSVDDPGLLSVLEKLTVERDRARREFAEARLRYRDRLDALKVELGLSPRARVVPDGDHVAPFRAVFAEIDRWQKDPSRNPDDLPRIVKRLAPLDWGGLDVAPGGGTLAAVAADPARLEPALAAAEALAIKNRGGNDPDGRIALEVRQRMRRLLEAYTAYEDGKRALVSAQVLKDREFELMIAPPQPSSVKSVAQHAFDLVAINTEINKLRSRLVSHWASFHSERIALARELRLMPARDWASFYTGLSVSVAGPVLPKVKAP